MRRAIESARLILQRHSGSFLEAAERSSGAPLNSMIFGGPQIWRSAPHQLSNLQLASSHTSLSTASSQPPSAHARQTSTFISAKSSEGIPSSASRSSAESAAKQSRISKIAEERLSLREIPGVGQRNAQLLIAAGYKEIGDLHHWFQHECLQDVQRFCDQLHGRVGIKQKRHRENIASYISSLPSNTTERQFVTLSVEGNISAGKSTFLNGITAHCPDLQDLIHVAPEPVDRWQNVGNHNLLDKFYHDKERYAYTFQNYIFFTRMMQEQDSAKAMKNQPYRLLERSIFCDRMVFVESLKDSNIMSEMELSIYDSWFDPVVKMAPTLVPDGFIYLRATPQTCMSRLKSRSRDEETTVDISYLEDLHKRHDDWLYKIHANSVAGLRTEFDLMLEIEGRRPELVPAERIKKAAQQSLTAPQVPEMITSEVRLLNKDSNNRLHSAIHQLPALVLDCEKDIHDLQAQEEHASKVNTYFEYVKAMRKHRAQFMALEGITAGDIGDVYEKFNAAKSLLDPQWRPEVDLAFKKAMLEYKSGNLGRNLVYL